VLAGPDRVLPWEGCFNIRDLGGLPTADGRRVRSGALVRADLLCRLTEAGRAALVQHGVRTVVDVRFPDEVARQAAHPYRDGADGVTYLNVPVNAGVEASRQAELSQLFAAATNRTELNRLELDANPVGMARVASAIARAPAGGVVVHCHAGKDRTGVVVALLLALVGVPDDLIADDYALSRLNLPALTREWLDGITLDAAERERYIRDIADPAPEAMLAMLDHLRERHGGAEAYLLGGGVSSEEVALLRARLVEPG
jgi:protein-tyrosine phosphatase